VVREGTTRLDVRGRARARFAMTLGKPAQAVPQLALNGQVENRLPTRAMRRFPGFQATHTARPGDPAVAVTGSACMTVDESASAIVGDGDSARGGDGLGSG